MHCDIDKCDENALLLPSAVPGVVRRCCTGWLLGTDADALRIISPKLVFMY